MNNNQVSKYSPEEILEIFKEQHRLTSPLDPIADETFQLAKGTLIIDMQDAQDLLSWQKWTDWLNECYAFKATRKEWERVVKPVREKTLWEVCLFISINANKEIIKPIKLLGKECLSSAVFLTLKKNLKAKGANVENLRPSTNISEYLDNKDNFSPLLEEVTLTGVRTFDELTYGKLETKRRFKYWIGKLVANVIKKQPLDTGNLITFRDLVNKIIENNKLGAIE